MLSRNRECFFFTLVKTKRRLEERLGNSILGELIMQLVPRSFTYFSPKSARVFFVVNNVCRSERKNIRTSSELGMGYVGRVIGVERQKIVLAVENVHLFLRPVCFTMEEILMSFERRTYQ